MKTNYWLILGAMLSTGLLAQQATNSTPAGSIETPGAAPAATITPAAARTNAPAAKSGKKKSGKKSAAKKPAAKKPAAMAELRTVPLVPGTAVVVASNVNVRGQAKLKSEVVTRVTKGQSVTVIEEIVRNNSGPEEPSAWAKILLPAGAHAWINTMFIDDAAKTVRPKKLNVRSGPGENYSVIGLMQKGDAVKVVATKGDWTEIEPPTGAYAFMAAQYLKQEAEAPVVAAAPPAPPTPAPTPPEPAPAPATVASAPAVAPPPTGPPVTPAPEVPTPPAPTPVPVFTPTEPVMPEEPPPPRIVQREGIVRGMTSIQAPSRFVLINPEDRKDMDYLYTDAPGLDLRRYKGLRIIVTGEEGLDERWPNMPVLTIQKIQLVEESSQTGQ